MTIKEKYVLVCDDFRREDNGKIMVIGMYFGEMTVPSLPFPLPTLTFFCLLEADRPGTPRFTFSLRHEETGSVLAEGMGQAPVNDFRQPIVMPIKVGGLQLNAAGLYTFNLNFDEQTPIVSQFNVRLLVPTPNR